VGPNKSNLVRLPLPVCYAFVLIFQARLEPTRVEPLLGLNALRVGPNPLSEKQEQTG
jgi:hypothetical protein